VEASSSCFLRHDYLLYNSIIKRFHPEEFLKRKMMYRACGIIKIIICYEYFFLL